MALCEVVMQLESLTGGATEPLADGWIYWVDGGKPAVLRTDAAGRLMSALPDGDPSLVTAYTQPFMAMIGAQVQVGVSFGAKPVPAARLIEHPDVLAPRLVDPAAVPAPGAPSPPGPPPAPPGQPPAPPDPAQGDPNPPSPSGADPATPVPGAPSPSTPSAPATPTAIITLPAARIDVTTPVEHSLWPVLWEPVPPGYATEGLPQGAALWHDPDGPQSKKSGAPVAKKVDVSPAPKKKTPRVTPTPPAQQPSTDAAPSDTAPPAEADDKKPKKGLAVTENVPPKDPPPDAVRPRERGLRLEGKVSAGAKGVKIRILDRQGNPIALRVGPTAGAVVDELDAKLAGSPDGIGQKFSAKIWLGRAADAFGPVQIVVRSEGLTPNVIGSCTCVLVGAQIALVQDPADGQTPGSVPGEADEVVVVDFLESPQRTLRQLSEQARARRMIRYVIDRRPRPMGSAPNAKRISTPEMPMWMAELHLVGLSAADLGALLASRRQKGSPHTLRLELAWRLRLSWDGPDSGKLVPKGVRRYEYAYELAAAQTVEIELDAQGGIAGLGGQGQVANALRPAPTRLPFPVKNRRVPQVFVMGQRRRWGRAPGGTMRETVVTEWQPEIVDKSRSIPGREIIRGGDGRLALERLTIDGAREANKPPRPDADLPVFRVVGVNPPSPVRALIEALVEEYHAAHSGEARIQVLPLSSWQVTVLAIVTHESKKKLQQFDEDPSGRWSFSGLYHGREREMPLFGAPHGYGLGQLDQPPVTDDQAWSFVENIRAAVLLIMGDGRDGKAGAAHAHVSPHLNNPPTRRDRAVYQREIVRRYNGFREFVWNAAAGDWEVHPNVTPTTIAGKVNSRFTYPNDVLGTFIRYWQGQAEKPTFTWPVEFKESDYGPGI